MPYDVVADYSSIYFGPNTELERYLGEAREYFDVISGILFSLDDKHVPLRISRATLLDNAVFSHTDYWIPLQVYIQFESSSAWPTDPKAIEYVKTAFYLSLHKAIVAHSEYKDIEHKKSVIPTWKYLEVNISKFTYHLSLDSHSRDCGKINKFEAIKAFSQRERSFGPAIKMVKEWCCINLIPDAHELVEAVGIHVYVTTKPKSVSSGFFTILDFINSFDWDSFTLIVQLDGTCSEVAEKRDSYPISVRMGDEPLVVPNPYLISILIPLAGLAIPKLYAKRVNLDFHNDLKRDFKIALINPYNKSSIESNRENQYVIREFIKTLKEKFHYLILLYDPVRLDGITERVISTYSESNRDNELEVSVKVNPLCLLSMAMPYLTISMEGVTAVNIVQILSEINALGRGIIKNITF